MDDHDTGHHAGTGADGLPPPADSGPLNDRYELGEVIGQGGMAEVFRARDLRLRRTVAVKVMRGHLTKDTSFVRRFQYEARAAASLSHPNIVVVHDTDEDVHRGVRVPYIVMELVEGRTLRQIERAGERHSPVEAVRILVEVLKALGYSHRHGVVHRDVKPSNVMLTTAGEVKVMDFGIARSTTGPVELETTAVGVILGTPKYLSPEQIRGRRADARSDLYAAGCLLFELLTGRPPFTGDNPMGLAYHHLNTEPPAPSQLSDAVSPALDAAVLRALVKDPADRYPDADAMAAALRDAVAASAEPSTAAIPPAGPDSEATRILAHAAHGGERPAEQAQAAAGDEAWRRNAAPAGEAAAAAAATVALPRGGGHGHGAERDGGGAPSGAAGDVPRAAEPAEVLPRPGGADHAGEPAGPTVALPRPGRGGEPAGEAAGSGPVPATPVPPGARPGDAGRDAPDTAAAAGALPVGAWAGGQPAAGPTTGRPGGPGGTGFGPRGGGPGSGGASPAPSRRRRRMVIALVVVVVLLAGAVTAVLLARRPASPPHPAPTASAPGATTPPGPTGSGQSAPPAATSPGAPAPGGSTPSALPSTGTTTVPAGLAGLPLVLALHALEVRHLQVHVTNVVRPGVALGTVVGTSPGPGAVVPVGGTVEVFVAASSGGSGGTGPAFTPL